MISPSIGVRSLSRGRRGHRRSVCCGFDRTGHLLATTCGQTEGRAESCSGAGNNSTSSLGPPVPTSPSPLAAAGYRSALVGGRTVRLGFGDMEKRSPSFLSGSTLRSYVWCVCVLGLVCGAGGGKVGGGTDSF